MIQQPLFAPPSDWRPPNISQLPSWASAKRVCIDTETRDPSLKTLGPGCRREGSYIVGVAFAIEDGPAHYLPYRHASGDNLPIESVLGYLREQAKSFRGDIVGANLNYDLDWLHQDGIDFKPRFFRDVQVAAPLLDELQENYSLEAIAQREGLPGKDENLLKWAAEAYGLSPKNGLWQLPPKYVGPYAVQDVLLPLQILRRFERQIDELDLWNIYDLESRLTPILVKMRQRGVRIDFDKLAQIEKWSEDEEWKALCEIHRLTNVKIKLGDVWRPEPLARALETIGVMVPRTAKTHKPSVTADFLASIKHPVASLIRRARKVNKLRSTFAESVKRYQIKGRLHCTFNQLRRSKEDGSEEDSGARYGRISSSDLNIQQQPGKKDPELGLLWRQIYLPDEGGEWACLDFSQQEPRWAVHYAEMQNLARATEAGDRYRNDPSTDSHRMMADLSGLPREQAKILFLGLCYGMGGGKLCRKLGLPTEWIMSKKHGQMIEIAGPEGQAILDKFHREVPFIKRLAELCSEKANERGWVRTVLGRLCRFPVNPDGGHEWAHKALNRVIQGSSADQTKKALVDGEDAGHAVQIQVHDEFGLTMTSREKALELAEIMMNAVPCRVPHRVVLESGPSWGQLTKAA